MPKILIVLLGTVMLSTSETEAQQPEQSTDRLIGSVAFSGVLTPAEIMVERMGALQELDAEVKVSFTVFVPVIKSNVQKVQSIDGLPIDETVDDSISRDVNIEVPFAPDAFVDDGLFDSWAFENHVDEMLSRLQVPGGASAATQKGGSEIQGSGSNMPNCGGYGIGSKITEISESCSLGTVTNEYTCQYNPVTGGKDWYLTSSTWTPPNIEDCFPGPN